jgi:hypothetical protein
MSRRLPRPCLVCGRPTPNPRGRCAEHLTRTAYDDPAYRAARAQAFHRAGGRCEFIDALGVRCSAPALEAHHLRPLAEARDVAAARALNTASNLQAVCRRHNPRDSHRL